MVSYFNFGRFLNFTELYTSASYTHKEVKHMEASVKYFLSAVHGGHL